MNAVRSTLPPAPNGVDAPLPQSAPARAYRTVFEIAEGSQLGAFVVSFALAIPCGIVERLLLLPASTLLPLAMLTPGLLLGLAVALPTRVAAALAGGAFGGNAVGLLLAGLLPFATTDVDAAAAIRLASASAVGGIAGGVLSNLAYARYRPGLERRFAVGFPFSAAGALVGGALAFWWSPHASPGAIVVLSVAFAQGIGMLVVGTTMNVWWLYAHGIKLHARVNRRAVAATVIAIAALLLAMHASWLGLNAPTYALMIGATLLVGALRFPMRMSATLTSGTCLATMAVLVSISRAGAAPRLADAHTLIALQLGIVFAMSSIHMLSAGVSARLLYEQRLRQYARQLEAAEQDHRLKAASTVREGVSQSLAGVRFALSALNASGLPPSARRSLDESLELLHAAERDAEITHRELGPVGLEEHGVAAVLAAYFDRLTQHSGIDVALDARGPLDALSTGTRQLAFRIVADLVGPAVRSGAARRMEVAMEALPAGTPAELRVVVRDVDAAAGCSDGAGAQAPRARLALLRERVRLEGGDLHVGAAGDACEVRVTLPVQPQERD